MNPLEDLKRVDLALLEAIQRERQAEIRREIQTGHILNGSRESATAKRRWLTALVIVALAAAALLAQAAHWFG